MQVSTTRFGLIEVADEEVILFPEGLYGFEKQKRYVVIDQEEAGPFRMLQSLDEPALTFVVVDPVAIYADFKIEPSTEDLALIDATKGADLAQMAIVTLGRRLEEATLNLGAPLIVNRISHKGVQAVLNDTDYTTKEPLIPDPEA
ncbi:MAG: hypothetical protein A2508_03915 [Candidatus Lambdaproteobacteria bacterium RIFOXYD12_FULL_49_8]|uniref:Flagellar assembly factor FliW n=1 Tax=Candidatus Lambdaproteobacteria bacterium RIFOXYD2_FULL_50_16 TaxID=1817772 RepID=A0A1F6GDP7_9PROT|nr:MAG: hypothetical protein A2527_04445 [Candidatus Lambdaproteobacteria bacterium RIFOXYD2_FULL_50_16]OGG98302.1 MAG: hypothetical protein A2508_03915 [Candidatus Lambdaproteobacteria bacterium RIFOXYD12_FULL_49_8]